MNNNSKDFLKDYTKIRYSKAWQVNSSDAVRIRVLLRLIGSGKKVLDIGCYDGTIAALIKEKNNEVYGVDISQNAVELATQKGVKAQITDIDSGLPFSDDFFDVIFAGEVIEHVLNIDFLFDEIKRTLKSSGFCVITTPNLGSLGRRILLMIGKNPLIETRWTAGSAGHV